MNVGQSRTDGDYLRLHSGEVLSIFSAATVDCVNPLYRPAVLSTFTAKQTEKNKLQLCTKTCLGWLMTEVGFKHITELIGLSFSRSELHSYLRRYPNMRKRTQKMMQAVPMWMPMTMLPSDASLSLHWHRGSPAGKKYHINNEHLCNWSTNKTSLDLVSNFSCCVRPRSALPLFPTPVLLLHFWQRRHL